MIKKSQEKPAFDTIKQRHLHKIQTSDLELGMFVGKLDRDWTETPFLLQGLLLEKLDDITTLQNICEYVYVDVIEEQRVPANNDRKSSRTTQTFINKIDVEKELETARSTYDNASEEVHMMLKGIQMGEAINIERTKSVVGDCISSILRNENALVLLSQMKQSHGDVAAHSLRVCILTVALGKHLGFAEFELENIGMCALFHDVGKIQIPSRIMNKRGKLTREEHQEMQRHTVYGKKILMGKAGIYPGIVDIAMTHHERVDGKGYPKGIPGEQIPYFAKLIAIVDSYEELTCGSEHTSPRTSLETLRILFERRGSFYDPELVMYFIKMMGVFPAGNIVEMTNGEVGIILSVDSKYKLRPKVLLVLGADKTAAPRTVANLANGASDFNGRPYVVRSIHKNGAFGIQMEDFQLQ